MLMLSAQAESEWIRLKVENIIPLNNATDLRAISFGIGKNNADVDDIELSLSILPNQVIDTGAIVPLAWSASVTNRQILRFSSSIEAFLSFRGGFIAGDRKEDGRRNLYYPFLQFGLGMQLYRALTKTTYVAFMPEFGFIPGALYHQKVLSVAAPTIGLSMAIGRR